jgi:hypothetical protein
MFPLPQKANACCSFAHFFCALCTGHSCCLFFYVDCIACLICSKYEQSQCANRVPHMPPLFFYIVSWPTCCSFHCQRNFIVIGTLASRVPRAFALLMSMSAIASLPLVFGALLVSQSCRPPCVLMNWSITTPLHPLVLPAALRLFLVSLKTRSNNCSCQLPCVLLTELTTPLHH